LHCIAGVDAGDYPDVCAATFPAEQWAQATFELLAAYGRAEDDAGRTAAVHANRLAWLLGALACLHRAAGPGMDWAGMHAVVETEYEPAFRAAYMATAPSH
jgi:hypothetical protein